MSETNFTKLFSSITASTIWCESSDTKVVWITMLAMSDAVGFVYASIPGLANISQVSIEKTQEALNKFLSPDPYSRDSENEGQRIEEIDGGWAILNHPKYRKLRSAEERRAYQREFMRKKRGKEKNVSSGVSNVSNCRPQLAQEEGEEEGEEEKENYLRENSSSCSPVPYQKIVDSYHNNFPLGPKVKLITEKRKKSMKARWLNGSNGMDFWDTYFAHASESKFLTGINDRNWIADLDFFIRPDTATFMQEGKYHK